MFSQYQSARLASLLVLILMVNSAFAQTGTANKNSLDEEIINNAKNQAAVDSINDLERLEGITKKSEDVFKELEVDPTTEEALTDKLVISCTPKGQYCQNHWECCSGSCMSYLYKCVGEDKKPSDTEYEIPAKTPVDINSRIDGSDNVVANTETDVLESTIPPLERVGDCLPIGKKCYRHEECCTMRCHGFLHQCVT